MSGPRIYWDAHNYLSMGLCTGPAPDEGEYHLPEEVHDELWKELKSKIDRTSVMIEWDEDPEQFAKNLEDVAKWLRQIAASGLDPTKYHFRTDID